jgi:hypothetical protein
MDAPGSDDQEPGTTLVQFLYTGALNDGLYLGTGTVHATFTTELGVVQQDCTEAISVSGTFMVAD